MEEIKSRYSTRESFISELAFAMSNHDIQEEQYLNLTQQNLSVILREDYSWVEKPRVFDPRGQSDVDP